MWVGQVTVVQGNHFPKEDSLPHEKCDPFCMLIFNEQQVKTQVLTARRNSGRPRGQP